MRQLDIRIEDDTDNGGRGYRRLTRDELHALIKMGLVLIPAGVKKRYGHGGNDLATCLIADALTDRLMHYPAFGPARPLPAHSCGGGANKRHEAE